MGCVNKGTIILLPFITRTIIINLLGVQFLGLNSVMMSIVNMINITELGFSSAIVFSLYKPVADDDIPTIRGILHYMKKVYRYIALIVFIIGLVCMIFLEKIVGEDINNVNIYIVFSIYLLNTIIGYIFFSYKNTLLIAKQRNDIISNVSTLITVILNLAQIIVLILTKNYYIYIFMLPITTLISNFIINFIANKKYKDYFIKNIILESDKKCINSNISGLMIVKLSIMSRNSLDSIFISSYLGLTIAGIYSNYYYIITAVTAILTITSSAISSSVGHSIATASVEKNYDDFRIFNFVYLFISGICTVILLCLYQPFMKMWAGEDNMLQINLVIMFVIYFFLLKLGDIRSVYSSACGMWKKLRVKSIVEAICNLILNWVLVLFFGLFGILLATILTIFFINFIWSSKVVMDNYFGKDKLKKYYLSQLLFLAITILVSTLSFLIVYQINFSNNIIDIIVKLILSTSISLCLFTLIYFKTEIFRDSVAYFKKRLFKS